MKKNALVILATIILASHSNAKIKSEYGSIDIFGPTNLDEITQTLQNEPERSGVIVNLFNNTAETFFRAVAEVNPEWVKNIYTIYISDDELVTIPDSIGKLQALYVMTVSSEKLQSISEEIGNIDELTYLTITDSPQFKYLPESLRPKICSEQAFFNLWLDFGVAHFSLNEDGRLVYRVNFINGPGKKRCDDNGECDVKGFYGPFFNPNLNIEKNNETFYNGVIAATRGYEEQQELHQAAQTMLDTEPSHRDEVLQSMPAPIAVALNTDRQEEAIRCIVDNNMIEQEGLKDNCFLDISNNEDVPFSQFIHHNFINQ
ncbi:hypothetical protein HOD08_02905 [bacterium]|nr:hypothetical protein [bacterium]